ncbi:hypothetical protein [Herminiimonas sp. CN]|uniref:hypothetical protein n=1 Tax=Herminiimonas sp. CN TaxID=1349818 RepID=UPI00047317FA|nr:hypothetical protein [Herminiimonas sp. CN]
MTLLTKFATKKTQTAYEVLQNESGYFDAPQHQVAAVAAPKTVKKYMFTSLPQTAEALVARLNADIAKVDAMQDAFGKEITQENIAKLSAFLTANNIAF